MKDKDERIKRLFAELDAEQKGYLNATDLSKLIPASSERLHNSRHKIGKELVKCCDKTLDGTVTYPEFKDYIGLKEKELQKVFDDISTDNRVGLSELKQLVKSYHISIPEEELKTFIKHVDMKQDGVIDFAEWRDFLLFLPKNMQTVLKMYESKVDFNSDAEVTPAATTNQFKFLLAGGFAGAVSRTCTAPLDRLKVWIIHDRYCSKMKRECIDNIPRLCRSEKE
jgi:solute carrier family 25 phosphate transporter 23/24/25/41